MSAATLQVSGLTKIYGAQHAIDDVSFELHKGQVVGFLGPNGAGKSTTFKILTTYIAPTYGTAEVSGYSVTTHPAEVKKRLGYLPEQNPLYYDMYVEEYLSFIGHLHGMKVKSVRSRVAEVIGLCGITIEKNKKIGALSKGYKQRVGLAQSLVHDPEILILDEPTTGLDPNQLLEIRGLIKALAADKTVLFSSHIMQEVQAICDRAIIINKGKIVADAPTAELNKGGTDRKVLYVMFEEPVEKSWFEGIEGTEVSVDGKLLQVHYLPGQNPRKAVMKIITERDLPLRSLEEKQQNMSLEEVFRNLTAS